jgi:hypothetical protein
MSDENQGAGPKRPGSSWHAWAAQSGAGAPAADPPSVPAPPLPSASVGGVGDDQVGAPAPLLPAIVASIDRLEAAIASLVGRVAALTRSSEATRPLLSETLSDNLEAMARVTSAQMVHVDQIGDGLTARLDTLDADVTRRVDALGAGFAGPLGELGAIISGRLDELSSTLGTEVDAIVRGLSELDASSSPPLDLAPFERLQTSLDAVAAEVKTVASAPPPAPLAPPPPDEASPRLLVAIGDLAIQVAALQDEVTQLKRRVGVRAKVPIVIDDAQMDDIARRVAALVASKLEETFEIAD